MNNEKLTLAMLDVDEYQKRVDQVKYTIEQTAFHKPYFSNTRLITEDELQEAVKFEAEAVSLEQELTRSKTLLETARTALQALLPGSVVKEMKDRGKIIQASWKEPDSDKNYGPYAAYFDKRTLAVKRFSNLDMLLAEVARARGED